MDGIPLIGAVRLSRLTDETTSPIRQHGHIGDAVARERGRLIHTTEDLDISASKLHPFDRPSLGPWLKDPDKLSQYKGLIYWRLDRFVRSASDFQDMTRWAREHNKLLISATETMLRFDPNATGIDKTISDIIHAIAVAFAEMESYNLSVRVSDAKAHMRTQVRWGSEHFAFGYEPYKDGSIWKLRKSPKTMPIRRELENRILAIPDTRETIPDIARDFNSRGIMAPKNWALTLRGRTKNMRDIEWNRNGIYGMFEGDAALGYKMHEGNPVLDTETGMPVVFWEPLTTPDRLKRIRDVLESQGHTGAPRTRWSYWGRVLCFECGHTMNRQRSSRGIYESEYAACPKAREKKELRTCTSRLVPMFEVEQHLEDMFLDRFGDQPVREMRYVQGTDNVDELRQAEAALSQLVQSLVTVPPGRAYEIISQQIQALSARISTLEAQPSQPPGWETVDLPETNRERWQRSSPDERSQMLVKAQIVLRIRRLAGNTIEAKIEQFGDSPFDLPGSN